MHRLFCAIRPPSAICDILIDAMEDGSDLRWQSDDQLHLTLRFIGEVDRRTAEDVAAELERVRAAPFELALAGLGSFDHRRGGAVWAGIEPKAPVAALAAKIERACQSAGIAAETRAFHPHITIARWSGHRPAAARAFLAGRRLESAAWPVTGYTLFESRLSRHGAHYEPVADYPLI